MQPSGVTSPPPPRLARSLRVLWATVDECWPDRSKAVDGWIGDANHAGRISDHNPDSRGIVHALDITSAGIDAWPLVIACCVHPSTRYVIFRGRIFSSTYGFAGRTYTGQDPHHTHVHVSIRHTLLAEQSRRPWRCC